MKRKPKISENKEKLKQSQRIEKNAKKKKIENGEVCLTKVKLKNDLDKCNVCSNTFKYLIKQQKSKACHKLR